MKKLSSKRIICFILCTLLIAAMALCSVGCSKKPAPVDTGVTLTGGQIGQGDKAFELTVVDADGKETVFNVKTDKETVGDALLELGLISGEPGDYGLYVKTVNGIMADYDKDKTYWAFYIDGEYAMTGVDSTTISENGKYAFKIEK